jgi:LAO/AO transport system kinase
MLEMRTFREDSTWRPRVLMVQANEDQGVMELMAVIREHQEYLYRDQGKALNQARYKHLRETFLELLKIGVFERLVQDLTANGRLEATLQKILEKRVDPYSASEALIKETMGP